MRGRVVRELRNIVYPADFKYGHAVVKAQNQLLGLVDRQGWLALPTEYESIAYLDSVLVACGREGVFRVYNLKTKTFLHGLFESVFPPYRHLIVARQNGRWGVMDTAGQMVVPFRYQNMLPFREDLAWFREGGLWGVLNVTGAEEMSAQYDRTTYGFVNGFADVRVGPFEGIINRSGFVVLPPEYQAVGHFVQNRAWFKLGSKCGFVDTTGNIVVPAIYDDVVGFSEGRARVSKDGRYGYIDLFGREVTGFVYQSGTDFEGGYAIVRQEGKSGAIDREGNLRVPLAYDALEWLPAARLFKAKRNGLFGVVDTAGAEVIPVTFSRIDVLENERLFFVVTEQYESGLWRIETAQTVVKRSGIAQFLPTRNSGWIQIPVHSDSLIHRANPEVSALKVLPYRSVKAWPGYAYIWLSKAPSVVPGASSDAVQDVVSRFANAPGPWVSYSCEYGASPDESRMFEDVAPFLPPDQFRVKLDSKWGVYDARLSAFILEPTFDHIGERTNVGTAIARLGDSYGIVSCYTGRWIVDPIHPYLFSLGSTVFETGILKQDLYGEVHSFSTLQNYRGQVLLERTYDQVGQFINGLAPISIDGKWGYMDSTGLLFIPPRYDDAREYVNGYAGVQSNGFWGLIDQSGSSVLPCRFQNVGAYAENSIPVQTEGKWGYISLLGDTLIRFLFEDALPFRDGLAPVKLRGKWGLINSQGVLVQEPVYDKVEYAGPGLFRVMRLAQPVPVDVSRAVATYYYGLVQAPSGNLAVPCKMVWLSDPAGGQVGFIQNVNRPSVGYARWDGTWLWQPRN
jgi:hypothetical protein